MSRWDLSSVTLFLMRRHHILLLVVALIAVSPLFFYGCSCGHDFDFHIQSWLEAKRQLLHGTFRPHWVFSAAYNAGEPRFVFYPPLSWVLGELLALVTPIAQLPTIYTLVVLILAGQTMYRLAREFVSENAAALGAALYIANPYMLFTAFERGAFAELLAAAWMPLLLRAILKQRPTSAGIAVPLALLWLTNAPAAVIGSYTLAAIMAVRLVLAWRANHRAEATQHLFAATGGAILGLALTAFYLLPAAYERRFVQITMAVIVNMRVQDNFLFGRTGDADHDTVLRTASWIAVALLCATAALLAVRFLRRSNPEITHSSPQRAARILALLVVAVAFLLTPASRFAWDHIPQLAFLQFPWRLLIVVTSAFALSAGLAIAPFRPKFAVTTALALLCAAALTAFDSHQFRQGCDTSDYPAAIANALETNQGFPATDEYTPVKADNDALHPGTPAHWIAQNPAAFAQGSFVSDSLAQESPASFETRTPPGQTFLILNLRDYPDWIVSVHDATASTTDIPPHLPRADGLIALPLPGGHSFHVDIRWQRSRDEQIGIAISAVSALILSALLWRSRSRKIKT